MLPGTRVPEGQRGAGGSWPEARKQKSKNKGETRVFTATTSPPAKKRHLLEPPLWIFMLGTWEGGWGSGSLCSLGRGAGIVDPRGGWDSGSQPPLQVWMTRYPSLPPKCPT